MEKLSKVIPGEHLDKVRARLIYAGCKDAVGLSTIASAYEAELQEHPGKGISTDINWEHTPSPKNQLIFKTWAYYWFKNGNGPVVINE